MQSITRDNTPPLSMVIVIGKSRLDQEILNSDEYMNETKAVLPSVESMARRTRSNTIRVRPPILSDLEGSKHDEIESLQMAF